MTALGHWAARQGSRYAYVQVDRENRPRSPRTQRLGFGTTTATATSRLTCCTAPLSGVSQAYPDGESSVPACTGHS